MSKTRNSLLSVFFLVVALAGPAFALAMLSGDPALNDPTAAAPAAETLTGCIGRDGDSWTLTDADGASHRLAASEEIAQHEGHKVELSGSWAEVDGKKLFAATQVRHLGNC